MNFCPICGLKWLCNFLPQFASKQGITICFCSVCYTRINESSIDSVIRIFLAVLLLYLGFGGGLSGALAVFADVLGVILLLTGVVGFCPLYALFRFLRLKK